MKKNLFYIITLLTTIIILFLIQETAFKYLSKYFAEEKSYNLIKKYINETNHVRSHVDYSICNENNKPQCLLFNKITNIESKKTIYINGDSWAEGLRVVELAENIFSKFSTKNNIDIIFAGTTSYSFSPMLSQLKILNRDWDINPDIIVSIFDQTDIGDELCRYKNHRVITSSGDIIVKKFGKNNIDEVYNYSHFLNRHKIFYSNELKFVKIIKLLNQQIKKKKLIPSKPKCTFDVIQEYLTKQLSTEDKKYIEDIINQYIDKVFQYRTVDKLLIVTHPHKQHLQGVYKLDIGDIIEKVARESYYKERITLINFTKKNLLNLNDFIVDDPASHLKYKISYPKYASYILEVLEKEIN